MSGLEQFGKYTLLRKVATGGMAEIFLAKQTGFGDIERFVVIKRVLPHLTENPEFVRMFVDEMRIAAVLSHPNIVQIHDIGAVGEQYFIAMEYLEGRDLRRIMRKAASRGELVPLPFALRAISDICEGLHYAHNRRDNSGHPLNIIHRDVSPQNAMATVQGSVKMLDFGIAKAESQLNETRSGVLKGKYSYMSPEQAMGQPLDARSDIFAIGIILYELTTGRRLFKHENEIVVLKMVADADVPPPRMIDAGYPPDLEQIVLKALAKRAPNRYASCRDLQKDLQEFAIPQRLMMSPSEVGDYVSALFADEREDLDPTSMPPPEAADQFISFLEPAQEWSVRGTPSFPSLLENNIKAQEETSKTGSLSMIVQRARRRPWLTVGVSASIAMALLSIVVALTLGLGQADSSNSSSSPNPLIASTGGVDSLAKISTEDSVVSFGTIAVESTPPGAKIFVDGEEQDEIAPLTIQAVTVGDEHFIVAEFEGFTAQAKRIALNQDGDFRTVQFNFERSRDVTPARLTLTDLPTGATISIDGRVRGDGDLSLQPGVPHAIVVMLRGEELARQEVTPESGQAVQLVVRQPSKASGAKQGPTGGPTRGEGVLLVSSNPTTTAFIGQRALGPTPIREEIVAGTHTLRLVNRQLLINYSERIRVRPGQRIQRDIVIPQGFLRVSARPFALVSINGVQQGWTPLKKALYAGTYNVVLQNSELGRTERKTVRIHRGSDELVKVDWR